MTKLRRLTPALLLAMTSAVACADDFRWEVTGTLARDLNTNFPEGDPEMLSLGATWYFKPVTTDGVPLAEAAFLGRASYLDVVVAHTEIFDTGVNAQGASLGYYFPDTMFFASASVSRDQIVTALSSTFVDKEYRTSWFGALGIAPLDGLLITTQLKEYGYDPNLTARYVSTLPNGHYYAGSVSIVDPDLGDTTFGLGFDYYLDESTSLGLGYAEQADRWGLRAEKFLSPRWAVGVSAYTSDYYEGIALHATWRH